MTLHDISQQNTKNGKGVEKQTDPLTHASKFTPAFWAKRIMRPTYTRDGERREVSEWYARIQYDGRRETIGLQTNNREEGARRATKLYQSIRGKGWDVALAEIRPDSAKRCLLTIGDYLDAVQPLAKVRALSFGGYAYALRKIVLEGTGARTSADAANRKTRSWREKADKIHLAKLTPAMVEKWKVGFLAGAGSDPVSQGRARRSVNSFIRNARALFSRRILKRLSELGQPLPGPLPFAGVELERQGSCRYVGTVDAGALLRAGREELAKTDPDAWKIVLLALGAGLRRREIDSLCRTQIDFERGEIRIETHASFEAKTEDSAGAVFVDAGLLAELKALLKDADGLFVVENKNLTPKKKALRAEAPARPPGPHHYRCQAVFKRVLAWLRGRGVLNDKPLHTLRKEFGSLVAAASDIHTASRQLRHSNIGTTAAYYVDNRRRGAVPIGDMLEGKQAEAVR